MDRVDGTEANSLAMVKEDLNKEVIKNYTVT